MENPQNIPSFISIEESKIVSKYPIIIDHFDSSNENTIIRFYYFVNYTHFHSETLMTGKRHKLPSMQDLSLKYLLSKKGLDKKEPREKLVEHYKIHLMPKNKAETIRAINIIIDSLLKKIGSINNLIYRFSVYNFFYKSQKGFLVKENNSFIVPIIVICPSAGKDNAQKLLKIVKNLLKNVPGFGIVPRFSRKVNDLISYTQGDGDHKYMPSPHYLEFFEADRVHYKSDFTGEEQNHKLEI